VVPGCISYKQAGKQQHVPSKPFNTNKLYVKFPTVLEASFTAMARKYAVPRPPETILKVAGSDEVFPVHRIYCVGRNYADHVREMGGDPSREPPFFFSKPRDAVVPCAHDPESSTTLPSIPYALATENLHYEIELVVAIGKEGVEIDATKSLDHVFGYAVGVDLTRRDLQTVAKNSGRPWDCSKGFDRSAPIGLLHPQSDTSLSFTDGDANDSSEIWLTINGEPRQAGRLGQMTWSVPEIVSILSHHFQLVPGDLILTGTPSGVGPLQVGDTVLGGVKGLSDIAFQIVERRTKTSGAP
jgi:fumarylpyruvate hydrolase